MHEVLLVDDLPEARALMSEVAQTAFPGVHCRCAGSVEEARQRLAAHEFGVALVDLGLPDGDGTDLIRQIQRCQPQCVAVVATIHDDDDHLFQALQAGAQGYLLKESAGAEVVAAVRSVHAGRRYLSQKITETVIDDYMREHHARSPLEALSPRERQILQGVAEGKSTAEIARVLYLSPKTVDTYRSRLMQKLELDSVAGLVRFAIECGLTPP